MPDNQFNYEITEQLKVVQEQRNKAFDDVSILSAVIVNLQKQIEELKKAE